MRSTLLTILAVLLPCFTFADTASWCREQRRLATEQKPAEAGQTLRYAVIGARHSRLHAEAARCLLALAEWRLEQELNLEANPPLEAMSVEIAEEALKEARISGDHALEFKCALSVARNGEQGDEGEAGNLPCLDAAIASTQWEWFSAELFFQHNLDVAFSILDLQAEGLLAERRGDAAAAAVLFDRAAAAAEKASLPLTSAMARLQAARLRLSMGKGLNAATLAGVKSARATFATREDLQGLAESDRITGMALLAAGDNKGAREALDKALLSSREIDDARLEAVILQAIASTAPPGEQETWKRDSGLADKRWHDRVLERADRAAAEPDRATEADVVAELRAERVRRPDDAAEIDRRLVTLGSALSLRPELSPERRAALKALFATGSGADAARTLEALRRTEAFPVLVEMLAIPEPVTVYAAATETLALPGDLPVLLKLTGVKDEETSECAAAAVFRLATAADLPAIRKALESASATAAIWLRAILAREGDAAALTALNEAAKSETPAIALNALTALSRLGFATPFKALSTLPPDFAPGWRTHLVLGRAPESWGASLAWTGADDATARAWSARAANVRNDRSRIGRIEEEKDASALVYELPRTPAERYECGTGWIVRANDYIANGGEELIWAAEGSGVAFDNGEKMLRDRKENPLAKFAADDLEWHRYGAVAGTQVRVLTIRSGSAWARVRCIASPSTGEVVNNTLRIPFWIAMNTTEGGGGGLIPALERINLAITLTDLFPSATINIPGFAAIDASVSSSGQHSMTVTATLPVLKEGPGIGEADLIPMETIEKGTVTLRLKVGNAEAAMTFPLSFLVPPKKDKPDLVAAELILEPGVPQPGDDVILTLRARNIGKAVEKGGVLNARFSVLNPQSGEGKRTIDVRLFDSNGWRAGEWRTFEARPKVVKGWYMNKYAASWTLEMGDVRLSAKIDADEKLEEDKEDNNICELQVPLYLPDAEGRRLATEAVLAKMEPLFEKVGAAKTTIDAYMVIGQMKTLLQGTHVDSPEIDVMRRHVEAAVTIQVERIRVREAMAQVQELAKDPGVNKEKLKAVLADLVSAETQLTTAGIPVSEMNLTDYRNRVQAVGGVLGATADVIEIRSTLSGHESESLGPLKKVTDSIGVIDGALQWVRYAREHRTGSNEDSSDAIEGTASIVNGTCSLLGLNAIPGLSKFHQAALGAEIDYVDKGFRKEANALNAIAELIDGKPGAQGRLDAAVRDVNAHVSAGPFSQAASRSILLGMVKDVPVIGKLVDAITSWK